jgi:hemolysin activation/secretion protein
LAWLAPAPPVRAYDEAGASTFESGARLYRPHKWSPDEIPVPARAVPPPPAEAAAPSGPVFAIRHFDVVGNTLLPGDEVERTLAPFVTPKASFATIEQAREALQQRFAQEGFLAVAVGVPQQTVAGGNVRLDVTEARIGEVTVENENAKWFSDDKVLALAPHVRPGAILRESDLRDDLAAANANPDRHVRPVLAAGKQPGLVDVKLIVDDQMPLHATVAIDNDRTPGSPHSRLETDVSYSNLWDLEHSLSLTYITAPTDSSAVLIGSASYAAPMPWREGADHVLAYWAYSDTFSTVPVVPGLGSLGNGQSFGARYNVGLPSFSIDESSPLQQGLTAGIDYKDIKSTLRATNEVPDPNDPNAPPTQETAIIKSPIRYLPFQLNWWTNYTGIDNAVSFSLTERFNFAGLVNGGSKADFQANRGGVSPDNPVTGTYGVFAWNLEYRRRLSMADGGSFLANLSQSILGPLWLHSGIPRDSIGLFDDWALVLRANGQLATEPLIPTEEYAAGGVGTVRGYLQSEIFGDNAQLYSAELWARRFSLDIYPDVSLGLRPSAFYDYACMYNKNPGEGEAPRTCIYSLGVGLRLAFTRWMWGDLYLADPLVTTENTTAGDVRLHFRLTGGF